MMEKSYILEKAEKLFSDRVVRAKELRADGRKIIGYPCALVPLEMLIALDLIPYRIFGEMSEPATLADRALPASFCPVMRSCLDCVFKGRYDFLDGVAAVHSCDPQEKTVRLWESYSGSPYFHFLDMPITARSESVAYFRSQLEDFKKTLEELAGREMTAQSLKTAIELQNRQRDLIGRLYQLTRSDPPLISGTEIVGVIKSVLSLPIGEGNKILDRLLDDLKERENAGPRKSARLLIWTSTLDDLELMRLLEERAHVVIDDNCAGLRPFRSRVESVSDDPLEDLAHYYLKEISCARSFQPPGPGQVSKDFLRDAESRFGYLRDDVRDWKVDGAILMLVRYCDPFAFEMTEIKDYFDRLDIPAMYLEYDYTRGELAQLRTRVEAFLETLI